MVDTTDTTAKWQQAARAQDPDSVALLAVEITHPDIPIPVRTINDSAEHTIEGNTYARNRFELRLAGDVEGEAPRATLRLDNVGAALTQWIELGRGGAGAAVRLLQVIDDAVEWELTLDSAGAVVDHESAVFTLGFDPLLQRPAVQLRHDPEHSPGLF